MALLHKLLDKRKEHVLKTLQEQRFDRAQAALQVAAADADQGQARPPP